MGRWGRFLVVMVVSTLVLTALRAAGVGLILPLLLPVPTLVVAYLRMKDSRAPLCPTCELPLSYRRLGPSHGMLECPSMCGYRRLVGDPRARP